MQGQHQHANKGQGILLARVCPNGVQLRQWGGANIKNCIMEVNILVNGSPMGGVCRAIRASYGKCGFISLRLHTGQGITGVVTYKKNDL